MIFTLKEHEAIKGRPIAFYELEKDGTSLVKDFVSEVKSHSKYASEYRTILAYMDLVAQNQRVPSTKFRKLQGNTDGINEYEFKSDHLRIYLIQLPSTGKVIIIGGYKNQQKQDIKSFRSLKKLYIESLNR